ncbi:right-handed parallel beta-helix repeat-containing protein [Amycolatopsis sp. CA-230715]|uniref:right-handed parallel beta-helix repeat-containing protein n=1 Tax=Amycolatopsis sp. CA-230715 TaxID=2745196 RepID=UPI001C3250BE|nr:right-handed parallel beta-helix repeat-containing protein [Amycolatopsis sp. CA-230715]QWF84186.1 hypothetical protein HUW46_07634 [Amycolatopsis sp. CA-230715]
MSQDPPPRRSPRRTLLWAVAVLAVAGVVIAALLPGARHDAPGADEVTASAADLPLEATEYPVPDGAIVVAPGGNDHAAGTVAAPLRTVAAAFSRAPQGATIVLRGGTYRETVGMVKKRITLQPYPGEKAWLKGTVVVGGWKANGGRWRHEGWNPDLCRTCFLKAIIDSAHPLAGLPDMVFVDGRPLKQVDDADDVRPGTFFVDTDDKALVLGENPAGHTVEATKFDRLLQFDGEGARGSVIRGVGIAQYASNQDYGNRAAMVVANAPDVTLENTTFAWSASTGALISQPGGRVVGGSFVDNGLAGLVANKADGLRVTGGRFAANNQERFTLSGEAIGAAGMKVTHTKRPVIVDNVFEDNIASGWWCDLGCTDALVARNIARANAVNGLYYEVSSRAIIAGNVIAGNRARGLKISSSDGVRVHQNTFDRNALDLGLYNDPRSPEVDPYSAQAGLRWLTSGTVLANNLYVQAGSGTRFVESADYKEDQGGNAAFVARSDGNAYLRPVPGTGTLLTWSVGAGRTADFRTLAEFTKATGQDAHALQTAPAAAMFADPAKGDYRLRPGVPGVRAGQPLPADIAAALGVKPVNDPDIGVLTTRGHS